MRWRCVWAATTFRETAKHFRRNIGYQQLWMLKAHLDDQDGALAEMERRRGNVRVPSSPTILGTVHTE